MPALVHLFIGEVFRAQQLVETLIFIPFLTMYDNPFAGNRSFM